MKVRTQRTLLTFLRQQLGTWPEGATPAEEWVDQVAEERVRAQSDRIVPLLNQIREFGELFVGMANGPFLLIMKADDPSRFVAYADRNPTHEVHMSIEIATSRTEGRAPTYQTVIRAAEDSEAYRLTFGLPQVLEDHILNDASRGIRLAPGIKRRFLSEITVYRRAGDRDVIYRLVYTPDRNRRLEAEEQRRRQRP